MRSIFLRLPLSLSQASSAALASSILSLEKAVLLGADSAEKTASPSPAHPISPSRLAAAGLLSASRSVLRHAETLVPQLPGKAMCPWHLVALQRAQHSVRLYLQAAAREGFVRSDENLRPETPPSLQCDVQIMDAALAILTLAPPASESQCLAALFQALQGGRAFPLLVRHAMTSLANDLPASQPALAAAATAVTVSDLTLAVPLSSEVPYPCPCAFLKDNEELMQVGAELLDSFAASWLSLVSMTRLNRRKHVQNKESGSTSASWIHALSTSTSSGSLLEHPFWDRGGSSAASSSRLPLPPAWLLMEAHQLPGPIGMSDQSSSSGGLKEQFSSAGMYVVMQALLMRDGHVRSFLGYILHELKGIFLFWYRF